MKVCLWVWWVQSSDVQPSEMTGGFFSIFRLCLAIHENELLVLLLFPLASPDFICLFLKITESHAIHS